MNELSHLINYYELCAVNNLQSISKCFIEVMISDYNLTPTIIIQFREMIYQICHTGGPVFPDKVVVPPPSLTLDVIQW